MTQSYAGRLPYTDEGNERIANQEHLELGTFGAKKVVIYDSAGGEVTSTNTIPTSIVSGTTTVAAAGTAQRITASSTPIKGVWLSADLIAGIVVVVGDSSVVGNASGMKGIVLTPGSPAIFLVVANLNLLYVDAQTNGGKLAYAYTV